ncbi:hypothetical protein IscW_ISCW023471 [Ixodes scapularis]|uniref:Secreted protein n=1 Tax=Ixodes scapularis TaxID=6945 RepID=B7QLN8_IXOSC|nr:hypothetical protein IscW_ISCW023471 [Ixodes scapularis]|eukprot:XP_002416093.1 hypothetical protein IscW_ISCW023471 [Ixodes scapularis]
MMLQLQLHRGLVLSVPLYALPLLGLSTTQMNNLEATQRIALRICLGVTRDPWVSSSTPKTRLSSVQTPQRMKS